MKNKRVTYYLVLFLLLDLIEAGVLLCFFSSKEWWNNWMLMAPNLYMLLGAVYTPLMASKLDAQVSKQGWLYLYKGIKMALTIALLVLYVLLVKQGAKPFVLVTAITYLLGLVIETYIFMDYLKHKKTE